jgi:hypothetical protein
MNEVRWYLSLFISSVIVAGVLGFYIWDPSTFGMITFYGMLSAVIYILAGYIYNFIAEPKKETQTADVGEKSQP